MAKTFKNLAIGTLVAAAAGYVAGVLTAPKSGKETRQDIKDKVEATRSEGEKQLKRLHTELAELLDQAKAKGNTAKGKAKDEYADLSDKAIKAKQKTRELLSAVHEGEVDDKDLQKAVDQASKAIKHLKTYLSK
jgi:gas vesicle protein